MHGGVAACLEYAATIRSILGRLDDATSSQRNLRRRLMETDPVVEEVSRLLRDEAGMTARRSLDFLAELLGSSQSLPERVAFTAGVKRLVGEFGAGPVVAAAQQIRNREVHDSSTSSWPLRRGR